MPSATLRISYKQDADSRNRNTVHEIPYRIEESRKMPTCVYVYITHQSPCSITVSVVHTSRTHRNARRKLKHVTQPEEPGGQRVAQASVFAVAGDLRDEVEGCGKERLELGRRKREKEIEDCTQKLDEARKVRVAVLNKNAETLKTEQQLNMHFTKLHSPAE